MNIHIDPSGPRSRATCLCVYALQCTPGITYLLYCCILTMCLAKCRQSQNICYLIEKYSKTGKLPYVVPKYFVHSETRVLEPGEV